MSDIRPAVDAFTNGVKAFLGPQTGQRQYLRWWSKGDFEVAIQREVGPHVWIAAKWKPTGQPFRNLAIKRYPLGKSRLDTLRNTPTLWIDHEARCIMNMGSQVNRVVECVRACALLSGVLSS